MTYRTFAAAAGAVAALAFASTALAQQAPRPAAAPAAAAQRPAAPAAPPVTHAALPPGVCVFDFQRLVDTSLAGKAVATRLQGLEQEAAAEVSRDAKALQGEYDALEGRRATLTATAYGSAKDQLDAKRSTLQRKVQLRQAELQQTQPVALNRLSQAMEPSLRAVYQQRACGILVNSNAAIFWNPAADITDAVVQNLNTKVQTISFDRVQLDQQPQAGQAPRQ